MDQGRAPLWQALQAEACSGRLGFHFPGHNGGRGLIEPFASCGRIDVTELPGLDDLHAPAGCIAAAQQLAANLWGSDRCFFVVNGSSAGMAAAVMASCPPGGRVLLPRDSHLSVYHGIIFSGAQPVYIPTGYGTAQIPLPPEAGEIDAYLELYQPAVLVVTSPNYFGICPHLGNLVKIAHSRGVPVVVDEAHGSHLAASARFPVSAGEAGADLWVQSWHKTLNALTQTAAVHRRGNMVDGCSLALAVQQMQTTSPSYLLLASMDLARRDFALYGKASWERAAVLADRFREKVAKIPGWEALSNRLLPGFQLDPVRVTLLSGGVGVKASEAAVYLRRKNINVELAMGQLLVLAITPYHTEENMELLADALSHLPAGRKALEPEMIPPLPRQQLLPREAWFCRGEMIDLDACRGRVAAEIISPYPPGVPAVVPGEILDREVIAYLNELKHQGSRFHALDPALDRVRVVC